jgi:hypothetical protein
VVITIKGGESVAGVEPVASVESVGSVEHGGGSQLPPPVVVPRQEEQKAAGVEEGKVVSKRDTKVVRGVDQEGTNKEMKNLLLELQKIELEKQIQRIAPRTKPIGLVSDKDSSVVVEH